MFYLNLISAVSMKYNSNLYNFQLFHLSSVKLNKTYMSNFNFERLIKACQCSLVRSQFQKAY